MSKTGNRKSSTSSNDADAQFIRDLEEAKRLSLETFGRENHQGWVKPSSVSPSMGTADFDFECLASAVKSPPPIGFISPGCFNANHSMYTSNGKTDAPTSSIPDADPSKQTGVIRSQSFPYGNYGITLAENNFIYNFNNKHLNYSKNFASNVGFNIGKTQSPSAIQNATCNSNSVMLPSFSNESTNIEGNHNLYKALSDEVQILTDDLIDLGQNDEKNILEYFDPLFDRPKNENKQQKYRASMPALQSQALESTINHELSSTASSSRSVTDVTPNYGLTSEISLYPSLPPPSSSLYGTLNLNVESRDQSILYDAYNQFEYLYAVSVSSESSNYYWYPNDASPYSQEPPMLPVSSPNVPLENREAPTYVSSQSVRLAKNRRTSDQLKRRGKLYEDITSLKKIAQLDGELLKFVDMLQNLRLSARLMVSRKLHNYIQSPTSPSECWKGSLSLKFVVWNEHFTRDPVNFTSDVSAVAQLVIEQTLAKLEIEGSGKEYILRVKGLDEYLDSERSLIDFQYIQGCIKLDEDVRLVLVHRSSLANIPWARPKVDDSIEGSILPEDIMPMCHSKVITFSEISKFLEVIDLESDKINEKLGESNLTSKVPVNPTPLIQTVKGICVLLGEIQTVEVRESLQTFIRVCENWNKEAQKGSTPQSNRRTVIGSDLSSRHSYVEIIKDEKSVEDLQKDSVQRTKDTVIDSVRMLIEMYSKSFPVSFQMNSPMEATIPDTCTGSKTMSEMLDPFLIRVSAIHRVRSEWLTTFTDYFVTVEVFHGTRSMGNKQASPISVVTKMDDNVFFNTVIINAWVDFEHLPICILPRECRLVLSVYGRKFEENGEFQETVELGWASIQCFDFIGNLIRGNQLLPLWPVGMVQKRLGPAPNSAFSYDLNVSLITIEFPDFGRTLQFPEIPSKANVTRDFQTLDSNTQIQLRDIIENATFTKFPAEDREVLWEKRQYLHDYPTALPKVLLSAQFWDFASLSELHVLMDNWSPLHPTNALQLLLPCFPDAKVRQTAIKWMSKMPDEDLITVLPQLVEALSYETFDFSPLAEFLLQKSLSRFEITHSLFWNLTSEVGIGKWLADNDVCHSHIASISSDGLFDTRKRRLELMRNSLLAICYHKWKSALIAEFKMMQGICDVTTLVKLSPASHRNTVLAQELKRMDIQLFGGNMVYSLPLSPAYNVSSLDVDSCICFNSASVPLKINFKSSLPEGGIVSVLFKQGDDIRQDMLTIQVIRMIETWWLKDGLDLRVVTFSCVPTGYKQGVVEIVCNSETLCKIQADYGVTGAFRNRPISEWLAKMNPSTLDYRRAVENFSRSCAAYCVLTYILGICDRHNDNIMLTNKGHLFHIDFGKFLGDAQMFGSFKRDRAPFVLTSDMLYVINDGEKSSQKFHQFVELCCQAFRIVRQNGDILTNLFAMMATAGIPGVDIKSVSYIQNALLPECSNVEAAARFTRFIEDSLRNWFTPVNFFIHSLAQLRFASDSSDNPSTISFIPKMYSMDTEGRIESTVIVGFQKKYDPEKYYSYTVKVKRRDHTQPSFVNRSYKQFVELYTKLCMNFPMAVRSLKALPRSSGIGRSNVKQVAEKRSSMLQGFLDSLCLLADEISHSDLVYTFFHPLLQDEDFHESEIDSNRALQDAERTMMSPVKIHGRIKACVQYSKGALLVLVLHAFDLACPSGQPPSTYVKSYLQPDPSRLTKRKTRVVKRSQHPTFMEMIEYRLPLDVVLKRTLQLSVWHHDPLQENSFLGGVSIPLKGFPLEKETTQTLTLGNLSATP